VEPSEPQVDVTVEVSEATRVTQLRAHSVGTWGAMTQSVGFVAPAVGVVSVNVLMAGLVGRASTFAYLVGAAIMLCVAFVLGDFAKKLPSAGSFYTYLTSSFGIKTGFVVGVLLFGAYILVLPFQIAFLGEYVHNILITMDVHIAWQFIALVLMLFSVSLAVLGVQPALSVALTLLAFQLGTFLALAMLIIVQGGAHGNSIQPLNPSLSTQGFHGILLAAVFTIFGFAGFESAATLGEEARKPTKTIPRAVVLSIVAVAVVYCVVTYAETIGFGLGSAGLKEFQTNQVPFNTLANTYGDGALSTIMNLAVICSFITLNVMTVNAVTRIIFGMGRDKMLPSFFGKVNRFQAPQSAALAVGAWGILMALLIGGIAGPINAAGYLAFLASLLWIGAYMGLMVGMPHFYWKRYRDEFHWFRKIVVPVVGFAGMGVVLYGTVYPFPASPYDYFIYVAIFIIVVASFVAVRNEKSHPERVREAGRLFGT
jgi:amino acid transporter